MSRPLYPSGKSPPFPLDRMLGGPQNRPGRRAKEKNLAFTGTRTPTPRASNLVVSRSIPVLFDRLKVILILSSIISGALM
jgi:hypothetical protein